MPPLDAAAPLPIRAAGVGFTYAGGAKPALREVAFEVVPGQVLLVVGPSGSGKSTLARAIAGLVPLEIPGAWQGSLRVGELEVATAPRAEAAARVGLVLQDPGSQLVMERAGDDVAFGLENRAWPLEAMHRRVPEALGALGLGGLAERRSARLSGGEQQRLAIAGVLAARPGVLVLDEPTANLDPAGTAAVYDWLRDVAAARTATVVLVEHRVEQAWSLADLVLALDADGAPIDLGTPAEVLARSRARLDAAGVWLPDGRRKRAAARRRGPAGEPALELRETWFGYERGTPVIHGVTVALGAGERVALVGANGSGKSTLLRLALGLLRPTAGAVRLDGREPSRLSPHDLARQAGYVVQDPELGFIGDSVREEIELGLEPADREHAGRLAGRLHLPLGAFGDRSPYRLSGGEQRRLSLVTALARRPRLLVLDEPTFGQDRRGHDELVAILGELAAEGTAILAATHDERFVGAFADRTIELDDGWIEP
ncbi:MAG TPA: ABC transporter ATP-binding protein [Candidatus Limnocylindrales bacterium]